MRRLALGLPYASRGAITLRGVYRLSRALTALVLAFAPLLLLPSSAAAASTDVIDRLDIAIDIRPEGTLEVTETYHWNFGSREGLGLTRRLDARFDYPPEPGTDRIYRYRGFSAASPSGAPAGVWVYDDGAQVRVDVGAPDGSDDRRTGQQVYQLSYTVDGALNAIRNHPNVPDQDELYWNATGHDWEVPIAEATVTVTGPVDVVDHACYRGEHGSTAGCDTLSADGSRVVASGRDLPPGSGLTVMAAFPPGTFTRTAPILEEKQTSPFSDEDESWTATTADFVWRHWFWLTPLGLAVPVLFGRWRVRRGRDLHYVGLTPGLLPAPGSTVQVAQLRSEPPVAVRFTPPDHLRPAEVGALDEKEVADKHVTATVIDLAVRGYLRIHEARTGRDGRPDDWLFVATPENAPHDRLTRYEQTLLAGMFPGRRQVKLSELRNHFYRTTRAARRELEDTVDRRRLFTQPLKPSRAYRVGRVMFTLLLLLGFPMLFGMTLNTLPDSANFLLLIAVGFFVAFGVAVAWTAKTRWRRTPAGRAYHEQSRGFERYLTTAEAHQLRFEEGQDIFSRYLPYAIVYGVAERWAAIFAELEAQGVHVQRPTWYVGTATFGGGSFTDLGRALSGFTTSASSSLSATPGSSGGSGSSSGGGGFSGGGGGGGGGGGR